MIAPPDGYTIRRYEPALAPQVVQLQTHLWSPDVETNRAYLQWKYYDNPHIADPMIFVAQTDDNRVVGMRGLYGSLWRHGSGVTRVVPCAGDVVIDPEHRNRGLFAAMTSAAVEEATARGFQVCFNLSAATVTRLSCLSLGWKQQAVITRMRRAAPKGDLAAAEVAGQLDDLCAPSDANGERPVRVSGAPEPEVMARLAAATAGDRRWQQVKDRQYFEWRFANPLSRYWFLYWQDTAVRGYIVLQMPGRTRGATVNILDWNAESRQAVADLLRAACRLLPGANLCLWTDSLGDLDLSLLRDLGFEQTAAATSLQQHSAVVLVRDLGGDSSDPCDDRPWAEPGLEHWELRMIDSDAF